MRQVMRHRGQYMAEMLIAHHLAKGVQLGQMRFTSYQPAGRLDLIIDDEIVATFFTAIHYMEDSQAW
jgi:hypothetical protein